MGDGHRRRLATVVAATTIAAVTAMAGAATAAAPPDTAPTETYPLVDGVFTAPDGSYSVAFAAAPVVAGDPPGFVAGVGEDTANVTAYPLDAFGATELTTPDERATLFLAASGNDIELLANTATRLGPHPAAYFIARLALTEGGPAMVYGAIVVQGDTAAHVIYTDVGGDDADTGTAFVESFTLHLPVVAPAAAPLTPVPASSPAESDPAAEPTTTLATTLATTLTPAPPPGATIAYDGSWWITFPAGATPALRARSEGGLAFAEYEAAVDDDVLRVRVTETPPGYERDATAVPGFPGVTVEPTPLDVGGVPAGESTTEVDAGTLHALVADRSSQLVTVTYLDAGEPSPTAAAAFLDSFTLP